LFAFSPLPSNVLFLAYGLTTAPLHLLAIPFFIGRMVSYAAPSPVDLRCRNTSSPS